MTNWGFSAEVPNENNVAAQATEPMVPVIPTQSAGTAYQPAYQPTDNASNDDNETLTTANKVGYVICGITGLLGFLITFLVNRKGTKRVSALKWTAIGFALSVLLVALPVGCAVASFASLGMSMGGYANPDYEMIDDSSVSSMDQGGGEVSGSGLVSMTDTDGEPHYYIDGEEVDQQTYINAQNSAAETEIPDMTVTEENAEDVGSVTYYGTEAEGMSSADETQQNESARTNGESTVPTDDVDDLTYTEE